jgi:hypothetical protein
VIGPEVDPAAIEGAAAAVGAKCAAPLGAHGNVVKLISRAYGQVLSQLETPPTVLGSPLAIRGTAAGQLAGRTAPMGVPGW